MWVGLISPVEVLNGTRRLSEKELLLPDCRARIALLPRTQTGTGTYSLGSPESSTCSLQISGLSFYNLVSQFLIINLFISISVSIVIYIYVSMYMYMYIYISVSISPIGSFLWNTARLTQPEQWFSTMAAC